MRNLSRACVLIFVLCSVVLASSSQKSSEQKLSGPEIKTLLENNTAHGLWEDREYFQFFDAKGPTMYREAGSGVSFGEWYASETQFCSIWSHQVSCYDVLRSDQGDGKQFVWVIPSTKQRYTFEVFKGNQMPTGR
jgi:hypothetical protein